MALAMDNEDLTFDSAVTVLCEPSCLADEDLRDEQSDELENENARGHSAGFSSTSGISRFVFVW